MSEQVNILELAKQYIRLRRYNVEGVRYLIHYRKQFWKYVDGKWSEVSWERMINDMMKLVNESNEFHTDTNPGLMSSVLRTVQALVEIEGLERGTYINQEPEVDTYYVPMRNGILAIASTVAGVSYELRPHTPLFFNDYILPYEYDPHSENNVFLNYLQQVLSPEEIRFLRQWFGYCLVPVTITEKFLLMHGEGGNGKSVVLLVLNLLLGEDNVSHVHLQGFYSQAAFDASDTVGKLCNTVQEIDKVKDVATGFLKEYTSGERMRANEKFKAAYDFVPTARLVFACNHLPGFKDDSDAFTRRILILHFKKQFLKKNANKIFKKRSFWLAPGVLTSVFNWALGGLSELVSNEWEFYEPQSMIESHDEYKVNASPEIEFLRDNLEVHKGGEVTIGSLYDEYKKYCYRYGFNREDKNVFGRLVRKVYPLAIHSGNQRTRNGKKDYLWTGIRLINEPKTIYLTELNPVQETQQTQQTQQLEEAIDSQSDGVHQTQESHQMQQLKDYLKGNSLPLEMNSVINFEEVLRAKAEAF